MPIIQKHRLVDEWGFWMLQYYVFDKEFIGL